MNKHEATLEALNERAFNMVAVTFGKIKELCDRRSVKEYLAADDEQTEKLVTTSIALAMIQVGVLSLKKIKVDRSVVEEVVKEVLDDDGDNEDGGDGGKRRGLTLIRGGSSSEG